MNQEGVVDLNKYFKFREAYRAFGKRFTEVEKQLERNLNDGRLQKIYRYFFWLPRSKHYFFKKTDYSSLLERRILLFLALKTVFIIAVINKFIKSRALRKQESK